MSTGGNEIYSDSKILDFYIQHLTQFGNSPQGVGWKDDKAQIVRFAQLSKIITSDTDFSINDLGCGAGRYYNYLRESKFAFSHYYGYDIIQDMIEESTKNLLPDPLVSLKLIHSPIEMSEADYSIASGIFNIKYDATEKLWLEHVLNTLESMNEKSNRGFAFNLLTSYSDKEYMQSYLYYADPLIIFDFCKKNFSKNIALLHDYFQYDFTILVRKD